MARTRTKREILEARARQLAGLRRGNVKPVVGPSEFERTKPPITVERARTFVKLLGSGLDCPTALKYMFGGLGGGYPKMHTVDQKKQWYREWLNSPLVLTATNEWNGGAWEDLPHDRRIELAMDHLDAQMAYFLYTTNYNADDAPLGKIADARSALLARIKSKDGGESQWEQAMRDLLEGKIKGGPPQLQPPALTKDGIPVLPSKRVES